MNTTVKKITFGRRLTKTVIEGSHRFDFRLEYVWSELDSRTPGSTHPPHHFYGNVTDLEDIPPPPSWFTREVKKIESADVDILGGVWVGFGLGVIPVMFTRVYDAARCGDVVCPDSVHHILAARMSDEHKLADLLDILEVDYSDTMCFDDLTPTGKRSVVKALSDFEDMDLSKVRFMIYSDEVPLIYCFTVYDGYALSIDVANFSTNA